MQPERQGKWEKGKRKKEKGTATRLSVHACLLPSAWRLFSLSDAAPAEHPPWQWSNRSRVSS